MAVWPNGSGSIPRVTSEFNMSRRNPVTGVVQPHWGIDLVGWSTIVAPAAGTIIFAGYNGGAGNEVRIRADNGDVYRLLHNSRFLRTGGRVSQGEGVAIMGTTGQSTGVHCHFETKPGGGQAINPRDYMARNGGGGSLTATQRVVTSADLAHRDEPNTTSKVRQRFPKGTVVNLKGVVRGEVVNGNPWWGVGGISGGYLSMAFLSPGNNNGLPDLTPSAPSLAAHQRVVTSADLAYRDAPNTDSNVRERFAKGTVVDLKGVVRGQDIEGNPWWGVGAHTGGYLSMKHLSPENNNGLPDVTPSAPAPSNPGTATVRVTVPVNTSNVRKGPGTNFEKVADKTVGPDTEVAVKGYTDGENVEGSTIWYWTAVSGLWMHSSCFVDGKNTKGIAKVNFDGSQPTTPPVTPTNPSVPENDADPKIPLPAGFKPRSAWTSEAIVGDLNGETNTRKIVYLSKDRRTQVAVHWDGGRTPTSVADEIQLVKDYERYHRTAAGGNAGALKYNFWVSSITGEIYEARGYGQRAMAVGGANTQTISILVPGGPGNFTEAAKNGLRKFYKTTNEIYGKKMAQKTHSDLNQTTCPGPDWTAWVHAGGLETAVTGGSETTPPVEPPVVTPPVTPEDTVTIPKKLLEPLWNFLKGIFK